MIEIYGITPKMEKNENYVHVIGCLRVKNVLCLPPPPTLLIEVPFVYKQGIFSKKNKTAAEIHNMLRSLLNSDFVPNQHI